MAVLFELDDRQLRRLPFVERLLTMTQHRLYTYSTPTGPAIIRLQVEHHAEPDTVGKIWNRTIPQSLVGLQRLLPRDANASCCVPRHRRSTSPTRWRAAW